MILCRHTHSGALMRCRNTILILALPVVFEGHDGNRF